MYAVSREPGVRSKVAVYSENPNFDPIGACIGEKGVRIASIIKELKGEKIMVKKLISFLMIKILKYLLKMLWLQRKI